MKISGFVFLIIGALVLSVSLFKKQLIFFTYIGALFILYGVFKMVFKWITNTSPAEIKGYNLNRQIPNTLNVHPKKHRCISAGDAGAWFFFIAIFAVFAD